MHPLRSVLPAAARAAVRRTRPRAGLLPAGCSMSRRLEVEFVNDSCAYVRGYGSRELLVDIRGRAPVWSTLSRAWVTVPQTARDIVAVAESRGYDVTVTDGERQDPGGSLW